VAGTSTFTDNSIGIISVKRIAFFDGSIFQTPFSGAFTTP
jgi:hypothetical protein